MAAPEIQGKIQSQGDLIHLELEGRSSWIYDVKKTKEKGEAIVLLTIDSLQGASAKELSKFADNALIKKVSVAPGADGKAVMRFQLAHPEVEIFDYMTDQPSRLIVDFFMPEATREKLKKTAGGKKSAKSPAKAKTAEAKAGHEERKPAGDSLILSDSGPLAVAEEAAARHGVFDAADPSYERFSMKDYEVREDAILKAKDNYYINFPVLTSPNIGTLKIRATPTTYSIAPKDSEENKMARLLLTLFQNKRWSVYVKTLEWFKEKFPESEYNDLIAYMTADVYYFRWKERGEIEDYEAASQAYRSAVQKYPKAAPAEKASFLVGDMALERGDLLSAIRAFDAHIANPQWSDKVYSKQLAKIGLGFAYMKLQRTDEAYKAFDDLEKTTPFEDLKVEAAYRKGGVQIFAKKYGAAIDDYRNALKKFPQGKKVFPGASYNLAEALFQTGDYRGALETYRDFIKNFPDHDEVPYALTRMGENLEILGADPTKVIGAYLETYFRFGENPKAIVARLRLLSARMKGMKDKETELAVKKILDLAGQLELPNIQQFATVLIADGYSSRQEYQKSIDLLSKYYKENPTAADLHVIKNRIVANIGEKLATSVGKGQFIDALKTHQQYADSWLKNSDRLDIQYFLGRAFEMGGVNKEAEIVYKDVLNKIYAARGTPQEKYLLVQAHLPSVETLNLRLAKTEFEQKNYQGAYDQLKQIKKTDKLTEPEQIERVDMAASLFENKGETASAVRYLTEILREWQGQPELVAEPYLRLAQMEQKLGRPDDAEKSLQKIDTLMKDSGGKVAMKTHMKALENLGQLYLDRKDNEKAIATYDKMLELYEEKAPMASIRYRLGKLFFEKGEIQKAAETWNTFRGDKSGFWKNLAQEQLNNSNWKNDYKKYIKRIPAMAKGGGE